MLIESRRLLPSWSMLGAYATGSGDPGPGVVALRFERYDLVEPNNDRLAGRLVLADLDEAFDVAGRRDEGVIGEVEDRDLLVLERTRSLTAGPLGGSGRSRASACPSLGSDRLGRGS
jgi:hypothetical protein